MKNINLFKSWIIAHFQLLTLGLLLCCLSMIIKQQFDLVNLKKRLYSTESYIDDLTSKVGDQDSKFDDITNKVDDIDSKLDNVESNLTDEIENLRKYNP